MAGYVEVGLIRIKKDTCVIRWRICTRTHFQSKAYYFGDMARLDMWCTCMIGERDNAQLDGWWCIHRGANQDRSFLEKSEGSLISKDST